VESGSLPGTRIDVGQDLGVDDATFGAKTRVDTDLDLYYGRIGWTWQFPVVPGVFTIGPLSIFSPRCRG
jgi:hypothetical protein